MPPTPEQQAILDAHAAGLAAKEAESVDDDKIITNVDTVDIEALRKAYKEVQYEAKKHRLKATGYRDERDKATAEAETLRTEKKTREEETLKEQQKYKELWEKSESDRQTTIVKVQEKAIDASLEAAASKAGIDTDVLKSLRIDKAGIAIDSNGNISGIDEALDRFKTQHSKILNALKAADSAPGGANSPPAGKEASGNGDGKEHAGDMMRMPGTNMTYGEIAKGNFGGGKDPKAATTTTAAAEKPDFHKMTQKDRDAWFKNYQSKLAR